MATLATDVLSEVLRAVRLSGAVFFNVEAAAPWVAEAPHSRHFAPQVLPGAEHVVPYHAVTRGACWGGIVGQPPMRLETGDVIVFPRGDSHSIASTPGLRTPPNLEAYRRPVDGRLPVSVAFNPGGLDSTAVVCGFLGLDARPFNPLLATLPPVIHVPRKSGDEGALVEQLIRVAVAESSAMRPGGEHMLARLSELLFVEMVRHHISELPGDTTGWLAGLRDELTGRALAALHVHPAREWSLDELAREVGTSRSMLAERFRHFVGVPPMHYLARWRMQLAASLLSGMNLSLAEVAQRVGYGSEAALSRAFKRLVGVAPSAWREGTRPPHGEGALDLAASG